MHTKEPPAITMSLSSTLILILVLPISSLLHSLNADITYSSYPKVLIELKVAELF